MEALELRMEALEDKQLLVLEQFRTLRGYVYAKRGIVGPDASPPGVRITPPNGAAVTAPASETREELKARLLPGRFTPGKPPNHSPE
jgi:hypothetical protein